MKYALDTNALSYAWRGEGRVEEHLRRNRAAVGVPAVVVFEARHGLALRSIGARRERALTELLRALPSIPFDERAAEHAADISARLYKDGRPIGLSDALIAGTVRANGLVLVTRNEREFGRVPGLLLEDWY